jgi:hypothetical protein
MIVGFSESRCPFRVGILGSLIVDVASEAEHSKIRCSICLPSQSIVQMILNLFSQSTVGITELAGLQASSHH